MLNSQFHYKCKSPETCSMCEDDSCLFWKYFDYINTNTNGKINKHSDF